MAALALTFGIVWLVPHTSLRVALATGVWIAAIAFRVGRVLGPRHAQFLGLACALVSPLVVAIERDALDYTVAEEWHYVHGGDDLGGVFFPAFVGPFVVAPLVALLVTVVAFLVVSPRERRLLDRASRIGPWLLVAAGTVSLVAAGMRARALPAPFPRRIEASDLGNGVVPSAWTAISDGRWEIVADRSSLLVSRRNFSGSGGYDVSVRRPDGRVVGLTEGLGPNIEIARDDRSDAWLVTELLLGGSPTLTRPHMALDGSPRTKLTVVDLARSMSAPKSTLVAGSIGVALATLLLASGVLWHRRSASIRWRSARIDSSGQIALEDGTTVSVPDRLEVTPPSPGTSVLVLVQPATGTSAYRHHPRVTRMIAGTLEERQRAIRGADTAVATCALAVLALSSAPLVAAISLGIGVGS